MKLKEALQHQANVCVGLGSPFMGQLMSVLADHLTPGTPLTDRLFNWDGDVSARAASVPLRLASAFHAIRLSGDADLAPVYPPNTPDDLTLWQAIEQAIDTHAGFIDSWIDNAPQTNEVRRAAVLIAAAHWINSQHALPMKVSELGASAGLNLMWDHFNLDLDGVLLGPSGSAVKLAPQWDGPLPPQTTPTVIERRGVDISPLNPHDPHDQMRLLSYLWPDQPDRLLLTRAAISTFDTEVDQADAIDWLDHRLTHQPGQLHLIYHTIAWQYFPQSAQARGTTMIEAAGKQATTDTPLAWLRMEAGGEKYGAGVSLRLWPGDRHIKLGRADFHGRWIKWVADQQ